MPCELELVVKIESVQNKKNLIKTKRNKLLEIKIFKKVYVESQVMLLCVECKKAVTCVT